MALETIFGIGGSALNAQSVRMNTIASNMANASTVAGSDAEAFRGKRAVFKAILEDQLNGQDNNKGGVQVTTISDDPAPIKKMHDPGNPMADKDGYVYLSNVNEMSEMVEMMAANRSFQNNVEVINTARQLMMRTLDIIKS